MTRPIRVSSLRHRDGSSVEAPRWLSVLVVASCVMAFLAAAVVVVWLIG